MAGRFKLGDQVVWVDFVKTKSTHTGKRERNRDGTIIAQIAPGDILPEDVQKIKGVVKAYNFHRKQSFQYIIRSIYPWGTYLYCVDQDKLEIPIEVTD